MLKLYDLTTEYKREPLGLDEAQPRFGWKLDSDQQDTVQASYRLRIVQGGPRPIRRANCPIRRKPSGWPSGLQYLNLLVQ